LTKTDQEYNFSYPVNRESSMILDCREISKHYLAPDSRSDIPVLKNITFSVKKGESVAILGPSGSGKSTLLNIIGLLDYPSSGEILMDNKNLVDISEKDRDILRNGKIGFIFQLHHLLPQLTVLENVLIPTLPRKTSQSPGNVEKRARHLLKRVELEHRLFHRPWQLSGGELQRVAFVRALINSPELVLADEPTGALDQKTSEKIIQLLIELNREEGTTMIVVTHSQTLAAKMDRAFLLEDGSLVPANGHM